MRSRSVVIWAAAIWIGLMAASFIVPPMIAPTGDGFTRGVNRLGFLLLFQVAAAAVAVFLFVLAQGEERSGLRWLMRIPLIWVGTVILGLLGIILWVRLMPV